MTDTLTSRLKAILRKDQILDTDLWREIYARDASYFDIKPQCIVRPESVEQVRQIIAAATATGTGVTFRTGGTSLSGQTVGSGIICELRTTMNRYEVRDSGKRIWFEPGITANQVNAHLKAYNTHIGPDPASSQAAMMGGILANNSSGMQAGTKYNSYHTMASIEFMLANGRRYNTALKSDRDRFLRDENDLCDGLLRIRSEILADEAALNKIVRKYRIKNVTGYAMNSFVDFDDPMDIFAHLLIGSEGTLGYIIAGELFTRPLYNVYSSSLLYFPTVTDAAASAAFLGQTGALAVEMMDYASLQASRGRTNDMPAGTTAMLVDYGASCSEEMEALISSVEPKIRSIRNLVHVEPFTRTVAARAALWKIRNGVFPCVAGVRVPGSTVILEDVAAPVEDLDRLVEGVQQLFHKYDYDGAIFGHARDGNIHPLVTTRMDSDRELARFRNFMDGFVKHVISLDGSLKGEHGTGRAIAPFVADEWGDTIYGWMCRVKDLADPHGILNPGVIINSDKNCYIEPIKTLDLFGKGLKYEKADKCMECGYCEHLCPSRYITLTPRQRLQSQRIINHYRENEKYCRGLKKEYDYLGRDTCCTDSTCSLACPLKIDTGVVTDAVREKDNPRLMQSALTASARHYGVFESSIRGALKCAVATEKIITPEPLIWATDFAHKISKYAPHWSKYFPMPSKLHYREADNPDFIYFPACVTRIFGASSLGKDDMISVILRIARRAGINVAVPKRVHGLCCSQIWQHKGDPMGQRIAANKTVETFWELSRQGSIPIFCDTTSCTHTLLSLANEESLFDTENLDRYRKLKIIDITSWLHDTVMPRLKVTKPKKNVMLHPTCASKLLGLADTMEAVARMCAEKVNRPIDAYCCAAAGDRGFIYPEVAKAATRDERREINAEIAHGSGPNAKPQIYDGFYSLARTCEISMMSAIGQPYESIVYLVDETTESK